MRRFVVIVWHRGDGTKRSVITSSFIFTRLESWRRIAAAAAWGGRGSVYCHMVSQLLLDWLCCECEELHSIVMDPLKSRDDLQIKEMVFVISTFQSPWAPPDSVPCRRRRPLPRAQAGSCCWASGRAAGRCPAWTRSRESSTASPVGRESCETTQPGNEELYIFVISSRVSCWVRL